MGMVFQSYAIWPHMNVFENIAFPLRAKRLPPAEIRDKVMTMLRSLGLDGLHDRPAPLLSGGQQQRVALGRALIGDPDVLLLDEPFSNLDARRRDEMRFELKEVQARVGVTTIFITHDQSEAMILSDRVLVMNGGRIVQEGTPRAIYERPGTRFVMEFLGQVDQLNARVTIAPDGSPCATISGVEGAGIPLDGSHPWQRGDEVVLMLRSAAIRVNAPNGGTRWRGRILSRIYLGERTEYIVEVGAARIRAFGPTTDLHDEGAWVDLDFLPEAVRAWPTARPAEQHQGGVT
jgi:iron(III) transport system ATP-binding protein